MSVKHTPAHAVTVTDQHGSHFTMPVVEEGLFSLARCAGSILHRASPTLASLLAALDEVVTRCQQQDVDLAETSRIDLKAILHHAHRGYLCPIDSELETYLMCSRLDGQMGGHDPYVITTGLSAKQNHQQYQRLLFAMTGQRHNAALEDMDKAFAQHIQAATIPPRILPMYLFVPPSYNLGNVNGVFVGEGGYLSQAGDDTCYPLAIPHPEHGYDIMAILASMIAENPAIPLTTPDADLEAPYVTHLTFTYPSGESRHLDITDRDSALTAAVTLLCDVGTCQAESTPVGEMVYILLRDHGVMPEYVTYHPTQA